MLYPSYLRDTLLLLAEAGLYRPLWSADILEELHRNLVKAGLAANRVDGLIAAMRAAFEEAEVVGYESLVEAMTCQAKDRHVLAAAVRARSGSLVTFNIRDFPPESINPYSIELLTADEFLLDLLDLAPPLVVRTLKAQAGGYKRDPRTTASLLTALEKGGVVRFADEVRRRL